MAVQQDSPVHSCRTVVGPMLSQEFRQQKRLLRQAPRILIVGKEIGELVAKDRQTTRLEHDDRRARLKVRAQLGERLTQELLGAGKKPIVVQRPSAAERSRRQYDVASGGLEHLGRRDGRLGMEVVV